MSVSKCTSCEQLTLSHSHFKVRTAASTGILSVTQPKRIYQHLELIAAMREV